MGRQYTPHLKLLMPDPDEPLTEGDLQRIFQVDPVTLDTSVYALKDMVLALANNGYTPVSPVVLSGNALKVYIENASTLLDIPAFLRQFPARTPVRITNFTMTMDSVSALTDFYELLDTLYGLDMNLQGLTKAQMHGSIRLTGTNDTITVTGAQMDSWAERYPSITVIPQRIENHVYYYNFNGSELLYTETVYDNADATYSAVPARESTQSGYMYSFRGWSVSSGSAIADAVLTAVSEDMSVYAAYAYTQDVAPTLSMSAYATAVGESATAIVTDWGAYDKITALTAIAANGNTVTASPGGGILSVSTSESGGETVTTVTVTPDNTFFNANGWALEVSDVSGSCTRSVFFPLRDYPVFRARNKSTGNGDPVVLDVLFNGWTLVSYTCTYRATSSVVIVPGSSDPTKTLTPGDGISVSGDTVTITPNFTPGTIHSSYLTFSKGGGVSVNVNVDIFNA